MNNRDNRALIVVVAALVAGALFGVAVGGPLLRELLLTLNH